MMPGDLTKRDRIRVIYVAGAFRGKNYWEQHRNILRAEIATFSLLSNGFAPLCPHKITEHFQGAHTDELFLNVCKAWLKKCDCIFMMCGWRDSKGSVDEHELAIKMGIPIYYEEEEK